MKKLLLPLIAAFSATTAFGQTIYLTADTSTIRKSTDGGATFGAWGATGTSFRGIAVDPVTGTVFVNDRNAGIATARPLYARSADGTVLSTATYDSSGGFNQQPVGYYNGYVYQSAGTAGGAGQAFGFVGFDGSVLASSTLTSAAVGNYQANDITYASSSGSNYMYYGGVGGTFFNRSLLNSNGTTTGRTLVTLSAASGTFPTDFNDYGITESGRLLTVGANGFWLSTGNQYTSNAISLNNVFSFSLTENLATGDMGPNARDFSLVGNTLFAVTNTNLYRYTLDDVAGTLTFVSGNAHGFNSANIQIAAVPEPTYVLVLGGLAALLFFRRRRAAQ